MTHDERMHQLLYSNEGRVEQCERICRLEELVRDMWGGMCDHDLDICCICPHWQEGYNGCEYHDRLRELGVEL